MSLPIVQLMAGTHSNGRPNYSWQVLHLHRVTNHTPQRIQYVDHGYAVIEAVRALALSSIYKKVQ